MLTHARTRITTGLAAVTLGAAAILVPSAAQATEPATLPAITAPAETSAELCEVSAGTLTWGVKESFRSYITSIAAGGWEVSDGTEYAVPSFSWSNPVGTIDAATGKGSVSFTGAIQFTGHKGVLNLVIANPTVEFGGDGTAKLRLDTRSNNVEGELVIDEQQAYLGKIEGISEQDLSTGEIAFADASAILTSEGATAFGGFYSSGDDLDPVTLELTLASCEGGSVTAGGTTDEEIIATPPVATQEPQVPWLPIIIGAVALAIIGVVTGMLIAGRKKGAAAGSGGVSSADGESAPAAATASAPSDANS